jgi:hypothetical protein
MTIIDTDIADSASLPYPIQLDALHERVAAGRLVVSPTGHLVASAAALPTAAAGPFGRLGLVVADAGPESAFGAGPTADRFAAGLLELHRDLLRRTLRQAVRHLAARTSGGEALLSKQLVQAQLADIAMALNVEQAVPPGDRRGRWSAHRRLVAQGRALVRLFGASGFLADGPATDLYLAEVIGNVYLHPDAEDPDD